MIAWPALTSRDPFLWSTRSVPLRTTVNSSNAGVWPDSSHPAGLRMWATLAAEVCEFTRPMYSSMSLGLLPADWMRVGCEIRVGMLDCMRLQFHIKSRDIEDRWLVR